MAGPAAVNAALAAVPAAAEIGRSMAAHLEVHGVDLEKRPMTLGPWVEFEANGDGIAGLSTSTGGESALERARYLLHETQRPPYVIPDTV